MLVSSLVFEASQAHSDGWFTPPFDLLPNRWRCHPKTSAGRTLVVLLLYRTQRPLTDTASESQVPLKRTVPRSQAKTPFLEENKLLLLNRARARLPANMSAQTGRLS